MTATNICGLVVVAMSLACSTPKTPQINALVLPSLDQRLLDAVKNSDVEQVGILLSSGKIKDINRIHGESLLQVAFDNYEFDIYRVLLNNGADPNILVTHNGVRQPILEYLYRKSEHDTVGYFSIMIGALLDAGARTDTMHLKYPFFIEILRDRVGRFARHGDLVLTNWLYLLYTVFNNECLVGNVIRQEKLTMCLNWMEELHGFFKEVLRNQIIEPEVGDIGYFMKSFDLCPENNEKNIPDAAGCE